MFQNLTYAKLSEAYLELLNDDSLIDMQDVSQMFTSILRNTKTPHYRFKTNLEFMVAAPTLYCLFGNAEDYLFDVTNRRKELTQSQIETFLTLSLTTNEQPNTF